MTDRPKRPRNANQLAKLIVDVATGDIENEAPPAKSAPQQRGGKVGGAKRAKSLDNATRSRIARKAAQARWGNKGND